MNPTDNAEDELRPEYDENDLKQGVRGKYAERYAVASNVVRVAPELSSIFPNEESVNEALRIVAKFMGEANRLKNHKAEASEISSPKHPG
jgi:hypothetical protein